MCITTPDWTHRALLEAGLEAGRHLICEKPLATTLEDAVAMTQRALESPLVVQVGFVLRYAPFFRRWHRFRKNSGGLLVHKACHTLDVLNWLVGGTPVWVSARGGTATFIPRAGAATRCRDCSLADGCPSVYRPHAYNWIYRTIQERENLAASADDLCVYVSEKDSVDNAVMQVSYDTGTHMTFSFATTGARNERRLLFVGQEGQIHASQADGVISVEPVRGKAESVVLPEELRDDHGRGDEPLMHSFFKCVDSGARPVADVLAGLHSIAIGVAATRSIDLDGQGIDLRPSLAGFAGG